MYSISTYTHVHTCTSYSKNVPWPCTYMTLQCQCAESLTTVQLAGGLENSIKDIPSGQNSIRMSQELFERIVELTFKF